MIKITDKSKCTGCFSCALSCPKNCIEMTEDNEGFLYPLVDTSVCVDCGLCEKNCSVITPGKNTKTEKDISAYAAFTKDDKIREMSSSGGIFTEIATVVLDDGGVVFGAGFDDDFLVKHIEITQKEDLKKLRGSKYVQSKIGNTYKSAKEYLKQGKIVLFSGTPCQIAGLYSFLGKEYENLITQDIICHGVPSPLVWEKYKKEQNGKLSDVSFRDKSEGWSAYSIRMTFEDGKEFKQKARENEYSRSFLSNICLRPSCYNCHFKERIRQSDITLADFWGIENVTPEMSDDCGTSLVFVNSKKGEELFERIKEKIIFKETDRESAVKYNKSMLQSASLHPNRKRFMNEIANKNTDFSTVLEKNIKISFVKRVLNKIKRIKVSNMKKKTVIILAIVFVFIAGISGACYWQRDNIKAVIYALKYDENEQKELRKENEKVMERLIKKYAKNGLSELPEEAVQMINDGVMTEDEAVQIITGEKTFEEVKEEIKEKKNPEKKSDKTTEKDGSKDPNAGNSRVSALVGKMYVLRSSYSGRLNSLIGQAKAEVMSGKNKATVASKYIGIASGLEGQCDAQVEAVLAELSAELRRTGGDMSLVSQLRSAYRSEKSAKKAALMSQY